MNWNLTGKVAANVHITLFFSKIVHWVLSSVFTCIHHTKNQLQTESFWKNAEKNRPKERICKHKHSTSEKTKLKTAWYKISIYVKK